MRRTVPHPGSQCDAPRQIRDAAEELTVSFWQIMRYANSEASLGMGGQNARQLVAQCQETPVSFGWYSCRLHLLWKH